MNRIATSDSDLRNELFIRTGAEMNILPGLVEKDFWVCWLLNQLFSIPKIKSHILFKGGTTLSKIFGVITRFSEDIDLAVDYRMLGFDGDRNPKSEMSNTKRAKLLNSMLLACQEYISGEFLSELRDRVIEVLGNSTSWRIEVAPYDRHVINFHYPRISATPSYLRPEVRLELGTHAELIPNGEYTLRPYSAEYFPDKFDEPDCYVQAIKIERTFWEKVTILHQEHFHTAEKAAPVRFSRHYYDTYMIFQDKETREAAFQPPTLLGSVVEHKKRFYPRRWARYDLAVPETLEVMPSDLWGNFLKRDYRNMEIMMFGEIPSFGEILTGLQSLENTIREMA